MSDSEIITSRDNVKLKFARSVRDGRESGLIFIEGVRLSNEAVRSGLSIRSTFVSNTFSKDLAETLENSRTDVIKVAEKAFASIADTENSQGIVLIAERPASSLADVRGNGPVGLVHQVNNPANLGALVRTAEAAGAAGLITTSGSADAYSPKALRASMGSAFRLPIIEKSTFDEAMEWARSKGLVTTAADISGTTSYSEINWKVPRLIIFGSEAHGLDERELDMIDEKIIIPMENEVESLNLAVSSGIILFEAKRQREM
jgi:TrmH family RNA methyltransferase